MKFLDSDKNVIEFNFLDLKCKSTFCGMRMEEKYVNIGLNSNHVNMADSVNIKSESVFENASKRKVKPVLIPSGNSECVMKILGSIFEKLGCLECFRPSLL